MARKIKTAAELGEAIKDNEDTIEITGDAIKKVIRIRATGKIAWVMAFGSLGIGTYSAIATFGSGGTTAPVTGTVALAAVPVATSVLGGAAAYTAIAVAIAAGGVGALNKLRAYKEVSRTPDRLVLTRK